MTIAQQIKAAYIEINANNGNETFNLDALIAECEEKAEVTQDWDNESTEYDFVDGSVLIINSSNVQIYASR